jgi:energy-coupling factor transport system permease protein
MFMSHSPIKSFHPLFWWLWAVTTAILILIANTLTLTLISIIATFILFYRFKSSTYWGSSFRWAVRLALIAFTFRMTIGFIIGVPMPGKVIFTLPEFQLPEFFVGIRVGGAVTQQRLLTTFTEAVLLMALILIFATANALSNPHSLLRVLPRRFYGLGLAGVIATSVAPQAALSISRVRAAKRLRGQSPNRLTAWRKTAIPVLEDALERSIDLAASLESRGYGHFENSTRYRQQHWNLRDFLGVSGPVYAMLAWLLIPNPPVISSAIILLVLLLTPVMAQ